jgi:hypothetical protein
LIPCSPVEAPPSFRRNVLLSSSGSKQPTKRKRQARYPILLVLRNVDGLLTD